MAQQAGDEQKRPANVAVLRFQGSDAQLLELVRSRDPTAPAAVFDRFEQDVNRLIWRCLGADTDHDDLVHETFLHVLKGMARVRDPEALRGWVASVAVNTARSELRKRRFRRGFWSTEPMPDVGAEPADTEGRDMLRQVYRILDRLPTDERIAFILRHVEQRPLEHVAEMAGCSLATIKRRLAKANKRFAAIAKKDPALADRLAVSKWGGRA
ncbi:MAG: RNA polymerase sigma factor [Nannocystales bacterium]